MSNGDPWAHRSQGMRCATCMWNVTKVPAHVETAKPGVDVADTDRQALLGRCRRHAPTMNGYPAVFEHDWCGDHKLDENKI